MSCKSGAACGTDESRAAITEELKTANQLKWVGLMNNVRITAEEIVQKEMIYV